MKRVIRKLTAKKIFVSTAFMFLFAPLFGVDVTPITSKFMEMAEPVFTVIQYIGIVGGVGGGIAMLLFRLINKDNNIWADALKILGAGAALASLSKIIEMIAAWATYGS